MDHNTEETLRVEDIEPIVKQNIESVLGDAVYSNSKVNDHCNAILGSIVKALAMLDMHYKYVVTCVIMQKNGAGMTTSTGRYWDAQTDEVISVPYENATMNVLVTVYGVNMCPSDINPNDLEN